MGIAHLIGLSSAVLVSTLVASFLPLYAPLSESKLEAISLLSCGILPGAALSVVIPEGVSALYRATTDARRGKHGHGHGDDDEDLTAWIGGAMLAGFLLMYLMDSVHGHDNYVDPTPHHHPHHSASPAARHARRPGFRPSPSHLAELEPLANGASRASDEYVVDRDGDDLEGGSLREGGKASKPCWDRSTSTMSSATGRTRVSAESACPEGETDHHHHVMQADASSISTVVGLVAHSIADGISLGASSLGGSSDTSSAANGGGSKAGSLQLVVFIAIMLHKAPTAFALSSLLASSPANSRTFIRRALLCFSFAAPVGALLTYGLLSLLGNASEGSGVEFYTGLALVFSGGTFLFVATHALREQEKREERQEHEQRDQGQPRSAIGPKARLVLVLGGMLLPAVLSRLVGHGH